MVKALELACDENDHELKNVPAETSERPATEPHSEPVAQRRADTLERLADAFFGNSGDAESSAVTGGDRCTINLHTTPDTLAADGDTAEAELESGACVSAETSRRLACDCGPGGRIGKHRRRHSHRPAPGLAGEAAGQLGEKQLVLGAFLAAGIAPALDEGFDRPHFTRVPCVVHAFDCCRNRRSVRVGFANQEGSMGGR